MGKRSVPAERQNPNQKGACGLRGRGWRRLGPRGLKSHIPTAVPLPVPPLPPGMHPSCTGASGVSFPQAGREHSPHHPQQPGSVCLHSERGPRSPRGSPAGPQCPPPQALSVQPEGSGSRSASWSGPSRRRPVQGGEFACGSKRAAVQPAPTATPALCALPPAPIARLPGSPSALSLRSGGQSPLPSPLPLSAGGDPSGRRPESGQGASIASVLPPRATRTRAAGESAPRLVTTEVRVWRGVRAVPAPSAGTLPPRGCRDRCNGTGSLEGPRATPGPRVAQRPEGASEVLAHHHGPARGGPRGISLRPTSASTRARGGQWLGN